MIYMNYANSGHYPRALDHIKQSLNNNNKIICRLGGLRIKSELQQNDITAFELDFKLVYKKLSIEKVSSLNENSHGFLFEKPREKISKYHFN